MNMCTVQSIGIDSNLQETNTNLFHAKLNNAPKLKLKLKISKQMAIS